MGRCYEFGVEIHHECESAMVVSGQGGSCECTYCGARCPGRFSGCEAVVAVPGRVPSSAPSWSRPGAKGVDPRTRATAARPSNTGAVAASAAAGARDSTHPFAGTRTASHPAGSAVALVTNGHRASVAYSDLAAVHASLIELRQMLVALSEQASEHAADDVARTDTDTDADTPDVRLEAIESVIMKLGDRDDRLAAALVGFTQRQAELGHQVEQLRVTVAGLEKGMTLPQSFRQMLGLKPLT